MKIRFKIFLASLLVALMLNNSHAQSIGVGTSTPTSSAALDVSSDSKGFLLPLLSQSQRIAIANPAEGLLVYDTSLNRFYQFQDGAWRYIINSDLWSRSSSRKFVTNTADSVGIGTSQPQHRLDVNGDILSGENIRVGSTINASENASASILNATGNITGGGTMLANGNLSGSGDMIIDNASATFQMRVSGVNKGFFQISDDDLRMGTNSGNEDGTTIFRVNGSNVVNVDKTSSMSLLKWEGDQELGKMVVGKKVMRQENPNNLLTILYGQVLADGYSPSMWPPSGNSTKISTGVYEIDPGMTGVSAKGVIVVTPVGSVPRICIGKYYSAGKFRVEIFNMSGTHVDSDFYFMINDPLN